ncbi:MAG: hypothetical protein WC602_05575 [archaeon]
MLKGRIILLKGRFQTPKGRIILFKESNQGKKEGNILSKGRCRMLKGRFILLKGSYQILKGRIILFKVRFLNPMVSLIIFIDALC